VDYRMSLAPPFRQLESRSLRSAADAEIVPQPEPRTARQGFIVAAIRGGDVCRAQRPGIRSFEYFL
jgi:hypothetical protein